MVGFFIKDRNGSLIHTPFIYIRKKTRKMRSWSFTTFSNNWTRK